jgi:hypothetical protein
MASLPPLDALSNRRSARMHIPTVTLKAAALDRSRANVRDDLEFYALLARFVRK